MKNLLLKEFRLAMHPTAPIFLLLSVMLIIPNYPYYVIFFYTGLSIFFTCLSGRENNDVYYTLLLPVAKKDVVKARTLYIIILEILQVIIAVPFAFLRQSFNLPGNQVGMDANIALFGLAFVMMGLFNLTFLTLYYKNTDKVGKAFNYATAVDFIFMAIAEVLTHIMPFMRDKLDTPDTQYIAEKLIVLALGIIIFAALTFTAYKKSVKSFETLDI